MFDPINLLQVGQVILDLRLAQFAEPRAGSMVNSFVAQEMVCRFSNDTNLDSVAVHFSFNGFLQCQQSNVNGVLVQDVSNLLSHQTSR